MINEIKQDTKQRMQKSIEALQSDFAKIRTGRASPGILEHVMVNYYGTETPLSHVAKINVADAKMLTVTPWEKKLIPDIEKAILNANLGLNPVTSGDIIRVPMPPMTEERRREMSKLARQEAENAKVAIRNIRRDANQHLKDLLKQKEVSEDDDRRAQDEIQKITDEFISKVDEHLSSKEKDLMAV